MKATVLPKQLLCLQFQKVGGAKEVGTVGKNIPGVEIKILNPDENGVGEVLARGQNVMQGYFNNKSASESALDDDGWLHTGDMGRVDHKKHLFLVGRAKEVVVTAAGEKIFILMMSSTQLEPFRILRNIHWLES